MVGGYVDRWIRERTDGWMSTWMEEWMDESRLESIIKIRSCPYIIRFANNKRLGLTGISQN